MICRTILTGHEGPVEAVHLYKNFLISGSRDKSIYIWDYASGEILQKLSSHTDTITSLDIYSHFLVSGSKDQTVKLWDMDTWSLLHTFTGHKGGVLSVSISGNKVASGSEDGTIRVWDIRSGECFYIMEKHTRNVSWVKIRKNKLFSSSWDHYLRIWDLSTGKCTSALEEHFDAINCAAQWGKYVATGDQTGYILLWDLETLEVKHRLKLHRRAIMGLHLTNKYLYSTSMDRTIRIWDIKTGVCIKILEGHDDATLGIYKRRNILVSSSADKTIRIWDDFTIHSIHEIKGHESLVLGIVAAEDKFVSAGTDNVIKLWDGKTGELLHTFETGIESWIWGLGYDGQYIVFSSDQGIYRIMDSKTGQILHELRGHQGTTYRTFIKNGKIITAGWDNTARVWDLQSGKCLQILRGHTYPVYSGTITDDDHYITGSSDGNLKVWDQTGKELRTIEYHEDEIFHISTVKEFVATASADGRAAVFNYTTGDLVAELDDHTDQVWTVTMKENIVFTGSADHTIKVWNMETEKCLDTFEGHEDNVKDLSICGNKLISGALDSMIRIWDVSKYFGETSTEDLSASTDLQALVAQIQMARTYDLVPEKLGEPGLIRIIYGMKPLDTDLELTHQKLLLAIKELAHSWSTLGILGYAPWLNEIAAGIRNEVIELSENESIVTVLQKFLAGLREQADLYWLGLLRTYGQHLDALFPDTWSFRLDFSGQGPNPLEGFEWIPLTSQINLTDLEDREETALVFRLTLQNLNIWVLPLIKAIEIQIKDDRGDVNYVHFNNFLPDEQGNWGTTAMFKIDAGYKMEPNALLNITDIRIIYDDNLSPSFEGSNILKQLTEIRFENQMLNEKLESLSEQLANISENLAACEPEPISTKKKAFPLVKHTPKGYKLDGLYNSPEALKTFKLMKNQFTEPRIGIIKVKIGEVFNKFLEHIQPKFILFNSATAIASAILTILLYLTAFTDFNLLENTLTILDGDIPIAEIVIYTLIYGVLIIILLVSVFSWYKYQFKKKRQWD